MYQGRLPMIVHSSPLPGSEAIITMKKRVLTDAKPKRKEIQSVKCQQRLEERREEMMIQKEKPLVTT